MRIMFLSKLSFSDNECFGRIIGVQLLIAAMSYKVKVFTCSITQVLSFDWLWNVDVKMRKSASNMLIHMERMLKTIENVPMVPLHLSCISYGRRSTHTSSVKQFSVMLCSLITHSILTVPNYFCVSIRVCCSNLMSCLHIHCDAPGLSAFCWQLQAHEAGVYNVWQQLASFETIISPLLQ